jgi:HupE/UreJ protein
LLFCAALGSAPAGAHDLPLDRSMNAFVKIEADQAHLLLRVPLDLLRAIQFPLAGGSYDIAAAGSAVDAALSALASDVSLRENGERLKPSSAMGQLTPLADRSFESYDRAAAHIAEPPAPDTKISYELGYLDAHLVYPITSPNSVFTIETAIAADLKEYTKLALRYLPPDGSGHPMMIIGGSGPVALNPAWYQASLGFVILGVEHILSGIDHLLFLLCLIIPYRRLKGLVAVITAFTLGHSVTLVGTAYRIAPAGAWFPPFIETAIAASIVYMALENIVGASLRRRWIIAGLFGLVHGFGFSAALKDQLQFAGSHLLVSLFSFNIGIEIGQLAVLCVFVPALIFLFRGALAGRMGIILASAIIAHTAWHWMIDRANVLWQTPWPRLTGPALMTLGQWVVALLLAIGAATFLSKWLERRRLPIIQTAEQRD